jgi:hypothetical protein
MEKKKQSGIRTAVHHESECLDNGLFCECEFVIFIQERRTRNRIKVSNLFFAVFMYLTVKKTLLFSWRSLIRFFYLLHQ